MIFLGNTPVMASVYSIMITLQRELKLDNSWLLSKIVAPKYEGADIQFCCPYHRNGAEKNPSAGITTIEKRRGNKIIPVGTFSCFACKKSGDITELISFCFGKKDGGLFGKEWILSHFNNFDVENRDGFFKKKFKEEKKKDEYIKEEELEKYRYYHPYMYKRHLTDRIIEQFDIGYDKQEFTDYITFPIRDIQGNIVFIARRSIQNKAFYYPVGVDKPVVYLYEMQKMFPSARELHICESIFNSLTLIKWNVPSVALLGTGSKNQFDILKTLPYRKYITVFDGDEAGRKAQEKFYKALKPYKFISTIEMPKGIDVNDLGNKNTYEEFLEEVKRKKEIENGTIEFE